MAHSVDENTDTESLASDDSLRFLPAQVGDTKELELYRPGGFHPVHLGDYYDDDRYRIVHKIGAGGFSTVWLARDEVAATWVALKIVVADKSCRVGEKAIICHGVASKLSPNTFVTYIRYFHIDGPNGRHLCLVQPFLGPSTYAASRYMESRAHPQFARKTALRVAEVLAQLHSYGLCHGDPTPSNVLFRIRNLDTVNDKEIYELFGRPDIGPLRTCSGETFRAEAPKYIVGYLKFMAADVDILEDDIALIDFDQIFIASQPPKQLLGTPVGYLAPEVAVGQPAGPASDVWALGGFILHLRSGSSPFATFDIDCAENLIRHLMEYMGNLPESWGDPLFDHHGSPTRDAAKGQPMTDLSTERRSLKKWIEGIWDLPTNLDILEANSTFPSVIDDENKPYPPCYRDRFWKPAAIRINNHWLCGCSDEIDPIGETLPKIPKEEVELLHDLMSKIFVYESSQQATAQDIFDHPWFRMDSL